MTIRKQLQAMARVARRHGDTQSAAALERGESCHADMLQAWRNGESV